MNRPLLTFLLLSGIALTASAAPVSEQQSFRRTDAVAPRGKVTKAQPRSSFKYIEPVPDADGAASAKIIHRAPDDGREYKTILLENFDAFTDGTETEPDYSRYWNDSMGYIDDSKTEMPGWQGSGIRSAGGNICIDLVPYTDPEGTTYEYGGYLTTPSLDLSKAQGETYLSFRARSIDTDPGYITISWTYPYEEGGQVTSVVYDGWALYENIRLDNCTEDCQITIEGLSSRLIIDWIKIEKFKPEIEAPEILKWTDYDDSGEYVTFTPHWMPSEGAEQYELHVFRYYDDGVQRKKVVKETKLTDTSFHIGESYKLDKQYTYYYYVIAKSSTFKSEESSVACVFDVMTPEVGEVTNNTQAGFRANWMPVNNACGYGYFNYLTHTAVRDEAFDVINENFDRIEHPDATIDNPFVSIIGLDDLDDVPISRANWRLYEGAYLNGAIGMHNRMIGDDLYNGQLVSPTMILAGSDKKLTFTADFISKTGTRPIVFLYCPVTDPVTGKTDWGVVDSKEISDITDEWTAHTVELQATSSLCILNVSLDDMTGFFFMDNMRLQQNLRTGEYVSLPYRYWESKEHDETTYLNDTPDRNLGDVYRFYVFAAREIPGSGWFTRYVTSEESETVTVPDVPIDGVRTPAGEPSKAYSLQARTLRALEDVELFRPDGTRVARISAGNSMILPAGIYLIRTPRGNAKFICK